MSKVLVGVVAAVFGGVLGYAVGVKQTAASMDLSESYIGTAGHTKTYVSIAQLLRKGDTAEALKLTDAMVNAGASRLATVPPQLDNEAKAQVASSLAAIQQYRQAR